MAKSSDDVRAAISAYLDPDGETKKLATAIALLMLRTDRDTALSAAVAAIALFHADPEWTKKEAMDLAESFGDLVSEELDEQWDALSAARIRHESAS